jgi:selenide,water dikinase
VVHADLLVGTATSDDAGVFRIAPELALVQTVDFFQPIVDDPFEFGAIAAANAFSDVYAMGGEPRTAMNIACFPQKDVPPDVLRDIIRGGLAKADEAGVVVVGGHTVIDDEIKFGMSVTGLVHPDSIWRNVGARPGDLLVLTKALGTGIVTTARKRGAGTVEAERAAIDGMMRLNAAAARAAHHHDVHACTDVTGFALLGHGYEMAHGSDVRLVFEADALPVLPEARELAGAGHLTGGCRRNRDWLAGKVEIGATVSPELAEVAWDPQTSGGLLFALSHGPAVVVLENLREAGVQAAVVGHVESRDGGAWVALR